VEEKIGSQLNRELEQIKEAGLYKEERIILTDQKADIDVSYPAGSEAKSVINFCANNYLGLANHPELLAAAHEALDKYGFGLASVRFICGTQDIHTRLEKTISDFYQTDDTILYTSCFDANGGLFESVLRPEDAIVTDELNHASIIDGIRLCKAERFIFKHANLDSLEEKLKQARGNGRGEAGSDSRRILVATDGVFSMDGDIAHLREIVDLAKRYKAMIMVDDSHATGFLGKTGRGSIEYCGVLGEIDIITSTLGKAMGGASGGFTTGRQEFIDLLRQRSRPYLFSNTLAPALVSAAIRAFQLLDKSDDLREKLMENTRFFRQQMNELGFDIIPGSHPIVPVMFRKFENDAQLAQQVSKDLYDMGIYVIGFFFPVVPRGQARIRVQISAAHTREHLKKAIEAFRTVGQKHGII
jgi:glycine C-acetyltransferase